jgi:hypothetical protein
MNIQVEKSVFIHATQEKVASYIRDFTQWNAWSPWMAIEPDCPQDIAGDVGATGHTMSWNGSIIGSGKNTLIAVDERGYHYDLLFLKPFTSRAKTSLLLSAEGEGTRVTWTMDSRLPFFLFFMTTMMKNMIGMDYERGLFMLKAVAEHGAVPAKTVNQGVVDKEGFSYVGIQRTVRVQDLPESMTKDFEALTRDVVVAHGKNPEHWVSVYPKFNMNTLEFTYIAAVSDEQLHGIELGAGYVKGVIPSGKTLEIRHEGSYEFLGNAWSMGSMTVRAKKLKVSGKPYEQYWNNPLDTKPEDLRSSVFFPVKGKK